LERLTSKREREGSVSEEPTRESAAVVVCPYCGSEVEVILDTGGAEEQSYVEDCEVCCQPWRLAVHWTESGEAQVEASTEDD
jgi:Cysteine-rich CPXCG